MEIGRKVYLFNYHKYLDMRLLVGYKTQVILFQKDYYIKATWLQSSEAEDVEFVLNVRIEMNNYAIMQNG